MKKVLVLGFLIVFGVNLKAQVISFKDANFKEMLVKSNSSLYASDLNGNQTKVDRNDDGEVDQNEALNISFLLIQNGNITNLSGIEYFINLEHIDCSHNQLEIINISQNIKLQSLTCYNNKLSSLDVSKNTELSSIECSNNNLTSINVLKNTKLVTLEFSNNQVTEIDVTKNIYLVQFYFMSNLITDLDISQNKLLGEVYCSNNKLETVNLKNGKRQLSRDFISTGNPNLKHICVDEDELEDIKTILDTNGNKDFIITTDCEETLSYSNYLHNDQLTLYPNPVENELNIQSTSDTEITAFEIYTFQGQLVISSQNPQNKINTSNLPKGMYIINVQTNKGTLTEKFVK